MAIKDHCKTLDRLLAEGKEKPWLEFKLNHTSPEEIGTYISALANSALLHDADRAFLVFGIQDGTFEKIGTHFSPREVKKGNELLTNWLLRKLDPKLNIEFHEFTCDGKPFVILEIEPSYFKPAKFDGEAYIRVGEHKKKLNDFAELERSLWLATGRRRFENAIARSNVSSQDVFDLLNWRSSFGLAQIPEPQSETEILARLSDWEFIKDELDGTFAITNLGALLLAQDITRFPSVSRKTVRVTQYIGIDAKKAAGEVVGRYGYAVGFEGLIDFIAERTPRREIYVNGVRSSSTVIPLIAIREVVANALVHQDLSAEGSGPIVEIYDNRIEVSNPGPPLGDINRIIDAAPRSRNELLAKSMKLLNLCEERGKGLDNAIGAIEDLASNEGILLSGPAFRVSDNSFSVTLFGTKTFRSLSREEKLRICYQHCVLAYLRIEYMSNSSLRQRFSLSKEEYQAVSWIINDASKSNMISPADDMQGKKNARYIPAWAKQ
jgi:ATP-dependent DNA helicase RecG